MTKTISATKKLLAVILAVLMMFSGMAVSASADNTDPNAGATTTPAAPTVPEPTVVLNETYKRLIVTPPAVEGYDAADVEISVTPLPCDPIKSEGSLVYDNLVPGTTYTVKAYVSHNGANVYSKEVTKTLKEQQNPPVAPVVSKVTSTTITIAQDTGCEYKLVKADDKTVIQDWTDKLVLFEKLTPDTAYILYVRKKATETKYASESNSITVKTLFAGESAPAKPVLVDKTDKTITVQTVKGVEFSIDKGNTWQTSGTFTGLKANTIYGVIARKTFDKALKDPSKESGVLEVKTNTRARYTAAPGKCTFTVAEGTIYAEKEIAVTVTGDGPAGSFNNNRTGEYGDTKFVPVTVTIGGRSSGLTRSKDNVYVGTMNPPAACAKTDKVEVTVTYDVYRHNGESFVKTGTTDKSIHYVDVAAEWGPFTMIAEAFTKLANLFLNTIPQLLTDIFSSEAASKLFAGITDLLGKLGKVTTK